MRRWILAVLTYLLRVLIDTLTSNACRPALNSPCSTVTQH